MSAAIDEEKLFLCSICLHLCRDTCPVATWSGRSDLVPSNKSRSAAAALGVGPDGAVHLELLDACTDCGACTAFCALDVNVADHLRTAADVWREAQKLPKPEPRPQPQPLRAIRPELIRDEVWALGCCTGTQDAAEAMGGRARRLDAPLGSACCGQRLPAGVGDDDLHLRMARGMLAGAPDGARIVVTDPLCGAHLQAAAGERVEILVLAGHARP